MPNKWRILIRGCTKFDFTVDEGNGLLNPSREKKSEGTHRRRKVEKSYATPAGASTSSLTSRINGMTTQHTHTLPLPLRFAPSARLTVGGTPCALWLVGGFSCDCMFWENSGGGLTTQPVGTATMTTVTSTNRVDLESFSSRCWTFRRTHTSADPIWVLCTRLALPLTLSLTSRLAPRARLTVDVPTRAFWLAGIFLRRKKRCAGNRKFSDFRLKNVIRLIFFSETV